MQENNRDGFRSHGFNGALNQFLHRKMFAVDGLKDQLRGHCDGEFDGHLLHFQQ